MMHLGKLRKRQTKAHQSPLKVMDEQVKSNPAWRGSVSILDAQATLADQSPFTYILSQGFDQYHYFLHYVGADQKVHHKNVRIRYVAGVPIFRNGGTNVFAQIKALIPSCLRCSQSTCKPLA